MEKLTGALISVAALGFILAVVSVFLGGTFLSISAEAFSRACTNLALIAIAVTLWSEKASK